ncbi:hypothetical protein BREVNS_2390 [Brevinematales bacterium NS]|nr:hypothetical protein BREVNS_0087 [Brevinematales bacterium NS]QJR23095.1 hypothetical protein BREVNS_2345 [Brevinematales bacterium NS]QJR23140.1 hypothetical protein BREVNS_2390 [Brevinematales bacterium NS]
MRKEFTFTLTIDYPDTKLETLLAVFLQAIKGVFESFVHQISVEAAEKEIKEGHISCTCGEKHHFIWKTKHGKNTFFVLMPFGKITLPQLQIQCKKCGRKLFLTRSLLGVEKRKRQILKDIYRVALAGALTTYRVAARILSFTGYKIGLSTLWKNLQNIGKKIHFSLLEKEKSCGEADGTGIPVHGKKKGEEVKILLQERQQASPLTGKNTRIAGLLVDNYRTGWDKLLQPIQEKHSFSRFFLVVDGDTGINQGKHPGIVFQRCLWHVSYQLKHFLRLDRVKYRSCEWTNIVAETGKACFLGYKNDWQTRLGYQSQRKQHIQNLLSSFQEKRRKHCFYYLLRAQKDMFACDSGDGLPGTTSRAERVMRTINQRMDVGVWKREGATNVLAIRLHYYYNRDEAIDGVYWQDVI